jgi:hypothetical protein
VALSLLVSAVLPQYQAHREKVRHDRGNKSALEAQKGILLLVAPSSDLKTGGVTRVEFWRQEAARAPAPAHRATAPNKFITVTPYANNRQRLLAVGEADAMKRDKFLRRSEASIYLKEEHGIDRAPATLADPRKDNPSFRHIDKVPYYAISDLNDWVRRKLSAAKQAVAKETSPAAVSSPAKQVTTAGAAKQDDEAAP